MDKFYYMTEGLFIFTPLGIEHKCQKAIRVNDCEVDQSNIFMIIRKGIESSILCQNIYILKTKKGLDFELSRFLIFR